MGQNVKDVNFTLVHVPLEPITIRWSLLLFTVFKSDPKMFIATTSNETLNRNNKRDINDYCLPHFCGLDHYLTILNTSVGMCSQIAFILLCHTYTLPQDIPKIVDNMYIFIERPGYSEVDTSFWTAPSMVQYKSEFYSCLTCALIPVASSHSVDQPLVNSASVQHSIILNGPLWSGVFRGIESLKLLQRLLQVAHTISVY